jgi:hypothetical protein
MGGTGNWEVDVQMKKTHETIWFYRIQIQSLIPSYSYFDQYPTHTLPKFHMYNIIGNHINDPINYS